MEKRLSGWKRELLRVHGLIADVFVRSEPRALSLAYLQGLLSGCERKNGWQLAEWMEEAAPYRVQHLLDRARWEADAARDKLRHYVVEELSSPDAVLIVDETGFLKKGLHSAGVKRQYSGTAGRIENSQVGVFLCYGSDQGAALVDRELYIPQEWAHDRARIGFWRCGGLGCSRRGLRPRQQAAPVPGGAADGLCAGCGFRPALVATGFYATSGGCHCAEFARTCMEAPFRRF